MGLFRPWPDIQEFFLILFLFKFSDEKNALICGTQIRQLIFSFSSPQNMHDINMISIKADSSKFWIDDQIKDDFGRLNDPMIGSSKNCCLEEFAEFSKFRQNAKFIHYEIKFNSIIRSVSHWFFDWKDQIFVKMILFLCVSIANAWQHFL